ncbi:MAG: leucine-rich repeat domain-containing protein [Treponema sp.]|jgi:hypothetical protein|nr:leucine-rich repeat domain-containing protein [Treponema sp.]
MKGTTLVIARGLSGNYSVPSSTIVISAYAFYGSTGLTGVTLPASLTSIGNYAFSGAPVRTVSLHGDMPVSLAPVFISNQDIVFSVTSPNSSGYHTEESGRGLMQGTTLMIARGLSGNYTLPTDTTAVSAYTFYGSTGLTGVILPASLTSIGNYAFYNCTGLRWVKWPVAGSNAAIGTSGSVYSFSDCTQLEKIELPNNLKTIYNYSFFGCTALRVVIVRNDETPGYLTALNNANAFPVASIPGVKFYVPNTKVNDYKTASVWSTTNYVGKVVSITALASTDSPNNW